MRIVMDTNVLVSGLLTPFGVCGEIVRMLISRSITICVDARILSEYESVLHRPAFQIDQAMIDVLMEYIESTSEKHSPLPLQTSLPDPDDNPFLEVAITAHVDYLITGNVKHFPRRLCCGIHVLSPRELIDMGKRKRRRERRGES